MDKIAKFLNAFSHNGPSDKSYKKWVDDADLFNAEYDVLKRIIKKSNGWYESLRDIRSDYVVHRAFSSGGLRIQPKVSLILNNYDDFSEENISLNHILNLEQKMFVFIDDINRFFCDQAENLPIRLK